MILGTTSSTSPAVVGLPPVAICEQARRSRDARFDGLFFTAVPSTGIYCRPVCPAPWASRVDYFPTAAAAEGAGYRPCLRCRPELAPGEGTWRRGDEVVARAVKLIEDGALDQASVGCLAGRFGLSERQLRRHFMDRVGVPPLAIQGTRRLLFAKQLLTETSLPITRVALESGFRSLRRFNAAMREAYRMAPRDLRRRPRQGDNQGLILRLGFRPPYDIDRAFATLRATAVPGTEVVTGRTYSRVLGVTGRGEVTWLSVSEWSAGEPALRLVVHGPTTEPLLGLAARIRRIFDLDADPEAIATGLAGKPLVGDLARRDAGARLVGGWGGFDIAVQAVLAQRASAASVARSMARLNQRFGTPVGAPPAPGLDRIFPSPDLVANADLSEAGIADTTGATIRRMAWALVDGTVDFQPGQTLDQMVGRWTGLPGVGSTAAQTIALRAIGHPDAFPVDNALRRRLGIGAGELLAVASTWRPWRGYGLIHLTRSAEAE